MTALSRSCKHLIAAMVATCLVLVSTRLSAQQTADQLSGPDVTVGITGHYRLGCWTAVQVSPQLANQLSGPTGLETVDGDGGRVVFGQGRQLASDVFGYCVPGGEAATLSVVDKTGIRLRTRFPDFGAPSRGPSMVPLEMPWVVALGDPLGIETIGANELLNRDARVAVSRPQSPGELPDSVIGYDGVDLIVVNGSGQALLQSLGSVQSQALVEWVRGGGRMLICLGESGPGLLAAAPWLLELLPFEQSDVKTSPMDPAGFESFTSSKVRLSPFVGVLLPDDLGRTIVNGRTSLRKSVPQAVEYVQGLGRVVVVASDLDLDPLARWDERLSLVVRVTGDPLVRKEEPPRSANRATSYDDLAGQTRTSLDRFESKRPVSFAMISLVLLALIVIVGPIDYLLINRLLGRPLLGWVTFPLAAIGISLLLISQSYPLASADLEGEPGLRCNRLEIIDIDAVEAVGRGFAWSYLYTHPARLVDVNVVPGATLAAAVDSMETNMTSPFGWPGRAFGGIQITGDEVRMPAYQVQLEHRPAGDSQAANPASAIESSLVGLPIAPRSSKSIATRFQFRLPLPQATAIQRRRGSELLVGQISNPLPVDLLDGVLVYRNWAYLLPTRFPAGARIDNLGSLRQKNFRWQLSRQRALEDTSEGESWDPSKQVALDRIAEMLMFHRAVGEDRYTTLKDQPLGFLDLTSLLTDDRCMLIGRLASPLTEVLVRDSQGSGNAGSDPPSRSPAGRTTAMLRLVLPVELQDVAAEEDNVRAIEDFRINP